VYPYAAAIQNRPAIIEKIALKAASGKLSTALSPSVCVHFTERLSDSLNEFDVQWFQSSAA